MCMTATTKRFIFILVLTLVLAGGLLWVLLQLHQRSVALSDTLQTIANQAAVQREFAALSELLTRTENDRTSISQYFVVGQPGSITFLNQVEALAAARSIELTNPRLSPGESEALAVPIIALSYDFSGSATAVAALIAQLEQLPYASYLQSLSVTTQEQPAGAPLSTGSFTIHAVTRESDV